MKPDEVPTEFVTSGPYRFSRHPMYLGLVLTLLGVALLLGSLVPFLAVPVFFALMEEVFIPKEEENLTAAFAEHWAKFRTRLRKWLLYALAIPSVVVSLILCMSGMSWSFWIAGLLFLAWAVFGFLIEYVMKLHWRTPFRWSIGVPYLLLYLSTVMFYWWPVGLISRPLWFVYAGLFLAATALNATSHRPPIGSRS